MGAFVDIEDAYLNGVGERVACEGLFTVTAAAGNAFTYSAPNCPDGTMAVGTQANIGTLAIVTNAYYAKWLTGTTIRSLRPQRRAISGTRVRQLAR
jgi:hypothetical protein